MKNEIVIFENQEVKLEVNMKDENGETPLRLATKHLTYNHTNETKAKIRRCISLLKAAGAR